ncbi:MAG: hypothetical protein M3505_11565, partial [Verrucomicrobiota bacterium]|nr:hypothetical protein [Verrucomicrobiota bacterium]
RCARAFRSKAYDPIRTKPLVQTTGADLLALHHANGNCVRHYYDDCTTWRSISAGSPGPSSRSEHGRRSEAKVCGLPDWLPSH